MMPRYSSWTVVIENYAELHLQIDEEYAHRYLEDKSECINLPKSSAVTGLFIGEDDSDTMKVCMGKTELNLYARKFKKTVLFGTSIENAESLHKFWQKFCDFLRDDEKQCDKHRNSSIELFDSEEHAVGSSDKNLLTTEKTDTSTKTVTTVSVAENLQIVNCSSRRNIINNINENTETSKAASNTDNSHCPVELSEGLNKSTDNNLCGEGLNKSTDNNLCGEGLNKSTDNNLCGEGLNKSTDNNLCGEGLNKSTDNNLCIRSNIIESINAKKASCEIIDIHKLHDPPPKYRVRDFDEEFVKKLTQQMIEKRASSIDNAPVIIGQLEIEKSEYNFKNISDYNIYIIDGNHNIKAQKEAYKLTNDPIFLYREVNIYCGLTPEEAIFLGVSRNEDTASFLKFSDFQKVDLLRRQLYSMTSTPLEKDPPSVPKSFRDYFISLLNLKGKLAVDGKNILRFLATTLSSRCYSLYLEICHRQNKVAASKFDCLRGLSEDDIYRCLQELNSSDLGKQDWRSFSESCFEKRKKKKLRKDVTITVKFDEDGTTTLKADTKQMPGNCLCFRFLKTGEKDCILTSDQLKDMVYGSEVEGELNNCVNEFSPESPILGPNKQMEKVGYKSKRKLNLLIDDNSPVEKKSLKIESYIKNKRDVYSFSSEISPVKNYIEIQGSPLPHTSNEEHMSEASTDKIQGSPLPHTSNEEHMSEASTDSIQGNELRKISGEQKNLDTSIHRFLMEISDQHVAKRVQDCHSQIQEEEVETVPEKLVGCAELLLDPFLQEKCKQFFTEDAWLVVSSTLTVLEGIHGRNSSESKEHNVVADEELKDSTYSRMLKDIDRRTCRVRLTDISKTMEIVSQKPNQKD